MSKRLDQDYYTQLSAWAESDAAAQAVVRATPVRASDATRAQMFAMLTDATADDPAGRQLLHRAAGRPSLSAGESPQWKVRAPRTLDADVRAVAAREGRTVSDVASNSSTGPARRSLVSSSDSARLRTWA